MKKKLLILIAVLICLILLSGGIFPSYASYLHPTDSGFTNLPVSVRAMGMGGAFVAIADDYSACYFNPAGLVQLSRSQLGSTYSDLYGLGLLEHSFLAFVEPTPTMGSGGVSWNHLSANLEPEKWSYDLWSYSYAKMISSKNLTLRDKLGSWGINLKYLRQIAPGENASGYSIDLGYLNKGRKISNMSNISWGFNLSDIFSQVNWSTGRKEQIPSNLKFGFAWKASPKFLLAVDLDTSFKDLAKQMHLGGEWSISNNFKLRAGATKIFQKSANLALSIGIGLQLRLTEEGIKKVNFNYAFCNNEELGNTHRFSLSLGF